MNAMFKCRPFTWLRAEKGQGRLGGIKDGEATGAEMEEKEATGLKSTGPALFGLCPLG